MLLVPLSDEFEICSPLSLSLSLSHTRTHTHTLTYSHTHTYARTHTHTQPYLEALASNEQSLGWGGGGTWGMYGIIKMSSKLSDVILLLRGKLSGGDES